MVHAFVSTLSQQSLQTTVPPPPSQSQHQRTPSISPLSDEEIERLAREAEECSHYPSIFPCNNNNNNSKLLDNANNDSDDARSVEEGEDEEQQARIELEADQKLLESQHDHNEEEDELLVSELPLSPLKSTPDDQQPNNSSSSSSINDSSSSKSTPPMRSIPTGGDGDDDTGNSPPSVHPPQSDAIHSTTTPAISTHSILATIDDPFSLSPVHSLATTINNISSTATTANNLFSPIQSHTNKSATNRSTPIRFQPMSPMGKPERVSIIATPSMVVPATATSSSSSSSSEEEVESTVRGEAEEADAKTQREEATALIPSSSSVVVLTTVNASKTQQRVLGSERIVTPGNSSISDLIN